MQSSQSHPCAPSRNVPRRALRAARHLAVGGRVEARRVRNEGGESGRDALKRRARHVHAAPTASIEYLPSPSAVSPQIWLSLRSIAVSVCVQQKQYIAVAGSSGQ